MCIETTMIFCSHFVIKPTTFCVPVRRQSLPISDSVYQTRMLLQCTSHHTDKWQTPRWKITRFSYYILQDQPISLPGICTLQSPNLHEIAYM